jgi:putative transposase
MPNYRRANFEGGYYFFTVVTFQRKKFLTNIIARDCLHLAFKKVKEKRPFDNIAICLLPDHLHCIWKLPDGDADFPTRWNSIKSLFTKVYLNSGGRDSQRNASRIRTGEAAVWQRRYWEHQIKDTNDLQKHIDYIHYNPVKHGLVEKIEDWPWSTYHKFVQEGFYQDEVNDIGKSSEGVCLAGE